MTEPIIQVLGNGPIDARIAIVGESPGAEEVQQGRPFVGSSGRLLDEMLHAAGIQRSSVYVTNVVKCRPPDNRIERLGDLNVSIADYLPYLERELRLVNPHIVVALGNTPLKALTGRESIMKWRGSVLPCTLYDGGPKVLPSLHPSYVLRDYTMHPVVIADLQKAKRESRSRVLHEPVLDLITNPTLHTIEEYLQRCIDKRLCAFDVETYGPRMRCIGFSCEPTSGICIPLKRGTHHNVWREEDEAHIWSLVARVFSTPGVVKLAQNAQFDLHFIVPHTGFPAPPLFDTMLAHHLVAPELPHDLDFLASMYSNLGYYGVGNVCRTPDYECWIYNIKDCIATVQSYMGLLREMEEMKCRALYEGYTMSLFHVLYEMQQRGVRIDTEKRTAVAAGLREEMDSIQQDINREAERELNPQSNQQLVQYFYNEGRYRTRYSRTRGTVTVDKTALNKLAAEGSVVAGQVLEYRQRQKLVSTFLETPCAPDGCMHTEYVISGTVTGRLSSRAPLTGWGTNLQNIPPAARSMFVPREGMCFVKGDLAQAENMLVAWLTKGRMQAGFRTGKDMHSYTAHLIFGGPPDEYGKGTRERGISKVINHACLRPDAEVLTHNGWVSIESFVPGDDAMVWFPSSDTLGFEPCDRVYYDYNGPMYKAESLYHSNYYTPNHKIPYLVPRTRELKPVSASIAASSARCVIPTARNYVNDSGYKPRWIKLLVAALADGSIEYNRIRFNMSKDRKIDRLVSIALDIGCTVDTKAIDRGRTRCTVSGTAATEVCDFIRSHGKVYSKWLLTMHHDCLHDILDEIGEWDGYHAPSSTEFYTKDVDSANWVVTLSHLCNCGATISSKAGSGYSNPNKTYYTVRIRYTKNDASTTYNQWSTEDYNGRVYCLQTTSGYFLTRFKGIISITGNSNYGMGSGQLAALLRCGQAEASTLLAKYHAAYPEVREWHAGIRTRLAADRTLRTPLGRTRQFLGRWGDELFRAAYSFIPQSTVADYLNYGLIDVWLRLADTSAGWPVLQVHDEIVCECPVVDAQRVEQTMRECVERPLLIGGEPLTIPFETRVLHTDWTA